jgi:xanthine dehydrogenase accessory factor
MMVSLLSGACKRKKYLLYKACWFYLPVQKANVEHNGEKVYFCCDGCKVSFEKEPEKYMV